MCSDKQELHLCAYMTGVHLRYRHVISSAEVCALRRVAEILDPGDRVHRANQVVSSFFSIALMADLSPDSTAGKMLSLLHNTSQDLFAKTN